MSAIPGILMPGATLGRYELLMPIAQGGMAAVWAARQLGSRGFEKTVAIKTMLPKLSDDPQFERMFLNEAALATRIQHPNVAQILDLGEHGELVYMVMEWVDGEALSTVMRAADQVKSTIPRDLAIGILERACWGLHAAHEVTNENDESAGIVHRDVSPQNILVAYNGAVKVVDFGVAKAPGLPGGETNTGSLKGKVPFMSPEQAQCGTIDRRTDIFAIGVMLYRMMTGVHPFVGNNDLDTLQNIVHDEPVRPRERDPSISPELEHIILTCLAKDRTQRFASMADLANALNGVARRISEQEIAQCIAGFMGPKGAQRRAQLKQAAKSLGWALQTNDQMPAMGMMTPSHPSQVSRPGPYSLPGQFTPSGQSVSVVGAQPWPAGHDPSHFTPSVTGPHQRFVDPQGKTFAAVAAPGLAKPREGGLSGGIIALIAVLAIGAVGALGALAVMLMQKRDTHAAAAPATATTATAAPTAQAATDAKVAAPSAVATATASAQVAAPSSSAPATSSTAASPAGEHPVMPPPTPTQKPPRNGNPGDPDMGF